MGKVSVQVSHPLQAMIKIPASIIENMKVHVQGCLPEEACGLLSGSEDTVINCFRITNHLHLPDRFRMDPYEQVRALMDIEKNGYQLIAIYHSHPNGPLQPSPTDLAETAYPDTTTLIWGREGGDWEMKAFKVNPDHSIEEKVVITIP